MHELYIVQMLIKFPELPTNHISFEQVNLFLAVLKTKFGKAQSLFRTRAQVNPAQRKNTIRKMLEWVKLQWTEFSSNRLASASQLVGQLHRPSKLTSVGPRVSLAQIGDGRSSAARNRTVRLCP